LQRPRLKEGDEAPYNQMTEQHRTQRERERERERERKKDREREGGFHVMLQRGRRRPAVNG
jgi:hypothetical protein